MLHLAVAEARASGRVLRAVTVDHGLRAGAAQEAAQVAQACAALGLPHDILTWAWDGQGNLQEAARHARYRLMAAWARDHGLGAVALAHTLEDQAETVLMRLARGAGVDGLSAMAPARRGQGVLWLRPLLAARRADLRDYLQAQGLGWCEDPSNEDTRFERVRTRAALGPLQDLGITAEALAALAGRMQQARAALEVQTAQAARRLLRHDAGDVLIDRAALAREPAEIRRRLIAAALRWITRADHAPRAEKRAGFEAAILSGAQATLAGVIAFAGGDWARLTREAAAVADLHCDAGGLWDNRWRMVGPATPEMKLRALGETGLAQCPDWRGTGRPRASLLASPSVWQGDRLVSAPLAGLPNGWRAELAQGDGRWPESIISD